MKPISIYIHIPFCKKKCNYCDFPSFSGCEGEYEYYVSSLIDEIRFNSEELKDFEIKTIFIGGGTPTVLPTKLIGKIVDTLLSRYSVSNDCEITIEANPGTIDSNILSELKAMYINRISMGVQAWQNRLLNDLGRIHDIETFVKNFDEVRQSGFKNVSTDLMFSLPNQSLSDWEETLEKIIKLRPEHISCYSLIIEEGTPFKKFFEEGKLLLPTDQLDRKMYYLAKEMLCDAGYCQYEISNFAKVGFESKHNIVYWRDEEYIGFGLGAHSYFMRERFNNTLDMKKYIQSKGNVKILRENNEVLTDEQIMSEFMFMGLRLTQGIEKNRFFQRFGRSIYDVYNKELNLLKEQKLLNEDNERIALTDRGMDISNYVFEKFLL